MVVGKMTSVRMRTKLTHYALVLLKTILFIIFEVVDWVMIFLTSLYYFISSKLGGRRGHKKSSKERKTVVVVGGSFGGLQVIKGLEQEENLNVILVDQREYYEYKPGVLSLFCHPERFGSLSGPIVERIVGKKDNNNNNNNNNPNNNITTTNHQGGGERSFILGTVLQVEEHHLLIQNPNTNQTTSLPFDYLVWATGLQYPSPVSPLPSHITLPQRQTDWKKVKEKTMGKKVLILGGGPVGCELAGELLTTDPSQEVVLVDAHSSVLHLFPEGTIRYVEGWLRERGVEVVLGQRIKSWGENFCVLGDGRRIEADGVFVCFGGTPNTQALGKSSSEVVRGCLDRRGFVETNGFLQVVGVEHVFAVGDVLAPRRLVLDSAVGGGTFSSFFSSFSSSSTSTSTSTSSPSRPPSPPGPPSNEMKQALYAEMSGKIAAKNIKALCSSPPLPASTTLPLSSSLLFRYPEDLSGSPLLPLIYIVSLGENDGSLGFNSLVVNGVVAGVMKWVIEETKVREMRGRPLGEWVWWLGDQVSFWMSRNVLVPPVKKG